MRTCSAFCIILTFGCEPKAGSPVAGNDSDCNVAALEICNGVDDDCDSRVDEGVLPDWFPDADGDGYGDEDGAVSQCDRPPGYLEDGEDCDDADAEVHPGAEELCNGVDDDCAGGNALEIDNDRDGVSECEGDCLDTSADAYPGAPEICDGLDDDCDGALPGDELNVDGDGAISCLDCDDTTRILAPGNVEVCDGLDNDCDGSPDNDCHECGLAVPNNFATVQEGIDSAAAGDVVCVGSGTWNERINFNGAAITLLGPNGPAETILDGDQQGTVVTFDSGEGSTTTMQGFTVQNGRSDDGAGGIQISGASPTLIDLTVTGNDAHDSSGGGICVTDGSPAMTRLLVAGNHAYWSGGGISLLGSTATLESVVIAENSGSGSGGGLFVWSSAVSLINSRISGNSGSQWTDSCGGGVYVGESEVTLLNVAITNNDATFHPGGGACIENSSMSITNGLIAYNDAYYSGSGLAIWSNSTVELTNVVIAYNSSSYYPGAGVDYSGTSLRCSHCDIYGNVPYDVSGVDPVGTNGNISVPPDLYDDPGHLNSTSPLIDAGDAVVLDPDGSLSDIGLFGGPGAADLDLDFDGYPGWWLPGPYDTATSPGLDCNDDDASVYPGAGC